MDETSTHYLVPTGAPTLAPTAQEREVCLGPDGSVAHVSRVIRMIQGRWKLPILFRLYADPALRTLQLKRDLNGISQKVLTAHLRELARDGLIERIDFGEKPLRVEYQLTDAGRQLLPVLVAARRFSEHHAAPA
jgi:DNA-binding HxlR family transcriptional regulator